MSCGQELAKGPHRGHRRTRSAFHDNQRIAGDLFQPRCQTHVLRTRPLFLPASIAEHQDVRPGQ
jgi:hypothetical protein